MTWLDYVTRGGYFALLFYVLRRVFDLAHLFGAGIGGAKEALHEIKGLLTGIASRLGAYQAPHEAEEPEPEARSGHSTPRLVHPAPEDGPAPVKKKARPS